MHGIAGHSSSAAARGIKTMEGKQEGEQIPISLIINTLGALKDTGETTVSIEVLARLVDSPQGPVSREAAARAAAPPPVAAAAPPPVEAAAPPVVDQFSVAEAAEAQAVSEHRKEELEAYLHKHFSESVDLHQDSLISNVISKAVEIGVLTNETTDFDYNLYSSIIVGLTSQADPRKQESTKMLTRDSFNDKRAHATDEKARKKNYKRLKKACRQ